jgi:hypothetical protein
MEYAGLTTFLVFLGLGLLDALLGGHCVRAGLRIVIGAAFRGGDRTRRERRKPEVPSGPLAETSC